mmetsp:Transcript_19943/g.23664  ORF Transcript_19943/g.23664 Transcript_19943/m.23664 type:complete len:87 (+) Transcript_19943:36-296(+)
MVNIHNRLGSEISRTERARMVLQVHDELIFDVSANQQCITSMIGIIRQCMEIDVVSDLEFQVPLAVKICVGPTWGSMHPTRLGKSG